MRGVVPRACNRTKGEQNRRLPDKRDHIGSTHGHMGISVWGVSILSSWICDSNTVPTWGKMSPSSFKYKHCPWSVTLKVYLNEKGGELTGKGSNNSDDLQCTRTQSALATSRNASSWFTALFSCSPSPVLFIHTLGAVNFTFTFRTNCITTNPVLHKSPLKGPRALTESWWGSRNLNRSSTSTTATVYFNDCYG